MKTRDTETHKALRVRKIPSRIASENEQSVGIFLYPAILVSIVAVLLADLYTPLGVAVWVVYMIPVTLSLGLWRPNAPLVIAAVSTTLMIYTFATDMPGLDKRTAQINRGFGIFTIWMTALVGYYFIRNRLLVAYQNWLEQGRTKLAIAMAGEQRQEEFGDNVLRVVAEFLKASGGAMFVRNGNEFNCIATYGTEPGGVPQSFTLNDGLLGQAVKDNRVFVLNDLPNPIMRVGSALTSNSPQSILIAPMQADQHINCLIELGFFHSVGDAEQEYLMGVSEAVGVAVRSGQYRIRLQTLLEETQQQAEELQVQSEELRVSNDELETQSRSLQDSQARLEQQQIDLEQTNTQLEEQTQLLESQKDDLARMRAATEEKARELERASKYKSDFLANMSHELRTPLNSSLILAKLLSDNPQGNLTPEQVRSAETIFAAGNDLLSLINDILDLSKIEAGHMVVRPDSVSVKQIIEDLKRTVEPLAKQKGLSFVAKIAKQCKETIFVDRQRLEQILKNLLSNAVKFTDKGTVTLAVEAEGTSLIRFTVSDTGIGISDHNQATIFDAFRQVDSDANRRYNGTGLGLSISRELANLLGGKLHLKSELGEGSSFSLVVPSHFDVPDESDFSSRHSSDETESISVLQNGDDYRHQQQSELKPSHKSVVCHSLKDDREVLSGSRRQILIVEDDTSFAKILYDLAHEFDFQCLIASTAEEALIVATQYRPNAIVLDVGLPDNSGLSVLEKLKRDSRTRHIPVHVISANDYTEAALSLGAVGYMLKPITRDRLADALHSLDARIVKKMKRVLVVEDDPVQRENLRTLLGSHDVETVGSNSAASCLEQLRNSTFDCMVLDLSLPDASGYSLLETLSQEDAYSFPPVIVYTARDLTIEEEQQLRRYSKSIIIKGAKSPERLLDEVTLFLHQVVSELPPEQQRMIQIAMDRDAALEGRRILVVEDDVRNIFALTSILEPRGAKIQIARNGLEALEAIEESYTQDGCEIDLVLMDVMMPEMDGLTATREIRNRPEWKKIPIIMLTAKAMKDDQENCIAAGANDYMAKPLDIDKLLSLVRVWIRR